MTSGRARAVLVAFGILLFAAAVGFWIARGDEKYLPWMWGPLFAAAGLSCWVFAWKLDSAAWWQTSRILVVLAILGRLYGIVGLAQTGATNAWRAMAGGCLYLLGAGALHRVWTIEFRYWSRRVAATGRR